MPAKKSAERQFRRFLEESGRPFDLLCFRSTHPDPEETAHPDWHSREIAESYAPLSHLSRSAVDALIVTGAPVGQKRFEDVTYWQELTRTFDWASAHVASTFAVCWAAAAALKHFHKVERTLESRKLFGVYPQQVWDAGDPLAHGLGDSLPTPVSRYSIVRPSRIAHLQETSIIAAHPVTGLGLVRDRSNRFVLSFNHPEYDTTTLAREYERDLSRGLCPLLPVNYFPDDNPAMTPPETWRSTRQTLARNWMEDVLACATARHVPPRAEQLFSAPVFPPAYAVA